MRPTVCYIGTLPLEKMGTLTQYRVKNAKGNNLYSLLGNALPAADVYVLECFKNHWEQFYTFKRPNHEAKIVSFMHSSWPCAPARESDMVVYLTRYSQHMGQKYFPPMPSVVIPGGIDFACGNPNYWSQRFGRIVRNAPGKFHDKWNDAARNILEALPDSELLLFTQNNDGLMSHERASIDSSLFLDTDFNIKVKALQRLSVGVFANGDFEEVLPMAALECMAAGLPIVYLYQPSMHEMIGDTQICCGTIEELERETIKLLPDTKRKQDMGFYARMRAREFTQERLLTAWNRMTGELNE